MNKLRRNITDQRFTVEGMRYDPCSVNCADYCFMVACTCDFYDPGTSNRLYDELHNNAENYGYQPNHIAVY